jgi:hypothetical protein
MFYYFIQLLISFYSPYSVFIVWVNIFLRILLSNTNNLLIMVSFNIHVSHEYVTVGKQPFELLLIGSHNEINTRDIAATASNSVKRTQLAQKLGHGQRTEGINKTETQR